jgi:hypothetical protein
MTSAHHPHHSHHSSHHGGASDASIKAEYILPSSTTTDVMNSCNGNDLAAAAAAVHLPTLMHMGYSAAGHHGQAAAAAHHHHLRQQQSHLAAAENQANMCSYLQHRTTW